MRCCAVSTSNINSYKLTQQDTFYIIIPFWKHSVLFKDGSTLLAEIERMEWADVCFRACTFSGLCKHCNGSSDCIKWGNFLNSSSAVSCKGRKLLRGVTWLLSESIGQCAPILRTFGVSFNKYFPYNYKHTHTHTHIYIYIIKQHVVCDRLYIYIYCVFYMQLIITEGIYFAFGHSVLISHFLMASRSFGFECRPTYKCQISNWNLHFQIEN
jgi:hypothetical protein